MSQVTRGNRIDAKPEAVWGVLSDFGRLDQINKDVDHSSLLREGPLAVGLTRRVQSGRLVVLERIEEVDEPRVLAYAIEGAPGPKAEVRNEWRLEPAGADSTDVHITTTVTAVRGPRLVERVMARLIATQSDRMLEGLADQLEANRV